MTRILKLLVVTTLLSAPFRLQAQTINAASCNFSDVQAALKAVTATTTTVNIPAGTCIWTNSSTLIFNAPVGSKTLTIKGQGSTTGSDSLGNPTGYNDQTIIIDHGAGNSILYFGGSSTQTLLRISGFTFTVDSGSNQDNNGVIGFGGGPVNGTPFLRVDHNHFNTTGVGGSGPFRGSSECLGNIYGWTLGVFDHNLFNERKDTPDNGIRVGHGTAFGDASGNGNRSWSNPSYLGTNQSMYFENNTYNYGISNDCNKGGRQVFRYNTFNDSSIQGHEEEIDDRGCRVEEAYKNVFIGQITGINSSISIGYRTGTGVVWGNTASNYSAFINLGNDRTNGHPESAPPNGFGYCGTLGVYHGPSNWDGNADSTGWPCLDQTGRGQGDLLTGLFPSKCDSTTSCTTFNGTWPHDALEPIYEWLDNLTGINYVIGTPDPGRDILANRDYYQYTTASTGASGTGSGLLSARPSTCTAGPGGSFGSGPPNIGGSPGVAYWATDTNTLYVCKATNTWAVYYTPYTYPHPIANGSGTSVNVSPPLNLTANVQ